MDTPDVHYADLRIMPMWSWIAFESHGAYHRDVRSWPHPAEPGAVAPIPDRPMSQDQGAFGVSAAGAGADAAGADRPTHRFDAHLPLDAGFGVPLKQCASIGGHDSALDVLPRRRPRCAPPQLCASACQPRSGDDRDADESPG